MSELSPSTATSRPEFRNIHAFRDLPGYRWPPAAVVSGMHRASGLMMFLLLPFIIWMFDNSISSEISFAKFRSTFNVGMLGLPGLI
jgi:succinate dehydrogenase / fumarate reductase cytochrome b subunit